MATYEELGDELEPQLKALSNFKIGKTGQIIGNRFDQEYSKEYYFSMVGGRSSEKEVIDSLEMYLIERFHELPNCDNEQVGGGDMTESDTYIVYIIYNK